MNPAPVKGRIDGLCLLLASLIAPMSSFVMWTVWTSTAESLGMPGFSMLFYWLALVLVFTAWGALPAAAFGFVVLWLVQRILRPASLWILVIGGMVAATLYTSVSAGLALAGQRWVVLFAPWAGGVLDSTRDGLPAAPVIVAIILSGAVGGLTYWQVARRQRQA